MQFIDLLSISCAALWANKLRSALTLVGIILGVSSIIAVMTGIEVVQNTVEQELALLNSQTFQIQKRNKGFESEEQRIEARQFPPITIDDANAIREQINEVDSVGVQSLEFGKTISFRGKAAKNTVLVCGCTRSYSDNVAHYIEYGRNLSIIDEKTANNVIIIGYGIAEDLFPFIDPIGQKVLLDGREFSVIGVFEEKKSALGASYDTFTIIPVSTYLKMYGNYDWRGNDRSFTITARAKSPELLDAALDKTIALLRARRNLAPTDENNFYYYTSDSRADEFNKLSLSFKIGGLILGSASLLVAGVGIMNIMLVSVTERTKEIGIRQAIGAKRKNILMQFLLEAVMLCNLGGIIGIAIGIGFANVFAIVLGFPVSISFVWIALGLAFCSTIGIVFGFYPAFKAAKLKPVDSLRFE